MSVPVLCKTVTINPPLASLAHLVCVPTSLGAAAALSLVGRCSQPSGGGRRGAAARQGEAAREQVAGGTRGQTQRGGHRSWGHPQTGGGLPVAEDRSPARLTRKITCQEPNTLLSAEGPESAFCLCSRRGRSGGSWETRCLCVRAALSCCASLSWWRVWLLGAERLHVPVWRSSDGPTAGTLGPHLCSLPADRLPDSGRVTGAR